ncbi:hypothetical protein RB195_019569 [Necator americanus]|uniref:DNA topoisomerase n=1 Tax=Necator americanus TaxID=51031 RepID=A0ABR1CGF7_NECAM
MHRVHAKRALRYIANETHFHAIYCYILRFRDSTVTTTIKVAVLQIKTTGVCGCLQECGGVMVLDPQSHPKWRLTCNKCPSVVAMFEGALKFRVTEACCAECDAKIVSVEYKDKSPLPDEKNTFKGCMFCSETVKGLVNLHHAFRNEEDQQRQMFQRGDAGGKYRVPTATAHENERQKGVEDSVQ